MRIIRRAVLIATMATLVGAPAALAGGNTRYAAVTPAGTMDCSSPANACSLETAVESAAVGDDVRVEAGSYDLNNTLNVPQDVSVAADDLDSQVTINVTNANADGVVVADSNNVDHELRRLTIIHDSTTNSGAALKLNSGYGRSLHVEGNGDITCNVNSALLQDSFCQNTKANGVALGNITTGIAYAEVRNITATADGANAIAIWAAAAPGGTATISARNIIAMSNGFDEGASSGAGATVAIGMHASNFDTIANAIGTGSVDYETIGEDTTNQDDPGTADDPQLVDPFDGDPHELAGSPTIDAGDSGQPLSDVDIDNELRPQGESADIGADEADGMAPNTKITKKPKKSTTSRTAKFKFTSTEPANDKFKCKIDGKAYKSCNSGKKTYKHLKRGRRHTFKVKATDAFGNTDASAATYKWKVKKPKQRHHRS